jgi:hypothetical protein
VGSSKSRGEKECERAARYKETTVNPWILVGAVILWNLSNNKNEKPAPTSVIVTEEGRFPDIAKLLLLQMVD